MDVRKFVNGSSALIARNGIKNTGSAIMTNHTASTRWMNFSKHTNCIRQEENHITKSGNAERKRRAKDEQMY